MLVDAEGVGELPRGHSRVVLAAAQFLTRQDLHEHKGWIWIGAGVIALELSLYTCEPNRGAWRADSLLSADNKTPSSADESIAGRRRRSALGTIPACAGSRSRRRGPGGGRRGHPRGRREHESKAVVSAVSSGPSPRARGAD